MAYDKNVWQCGDEITAEKLNHIEEGIKDASGFECVEGYTTLTEESVTTVEDAGEIGAFLTYSDFIDVDEIKVTFNGTEYTCEKNVIEEGSNAYGGFSGGEPDFTEYPFVIFSANEEPSSNAFVTPTAGTYQVKIETPRETVETAPCFEKAVKTIANILTVRFSEVDGEDYLVGDKTAQEVMDIVDAGGLVIMTTPPLHSPSEAGFDSRHIDIVNLIGGNQYIETQRKDNNPPRYVIVGNEIQAGID